MAVKKKKKKDKVPLSEDVEKLGLTFIAGGIVKGDSHFGRKGLAFPQIFTCYFIIYLRTPKYSSKRNKNMSTEM